MDIEIEKLKELKLAVGVVFQHWLDTAANQKGFDNTVSKKFFKKDEECIQELLDEAIARQSVKSEEDVQRAIAWLETGDFEIIAGDEEYIANSSHHPNTSRFRQTAITALQTYQPEPPKGE